MSHLVGLASQRLTSRPSPTAPGNREYWKLFASSMREKMGWPVCSPKGTSLNACSRVGLGRLLLSVLCRDSGIRFYVENVRGTTNNSDRCNPRRPGIWMAGYQWAHPRCRHMEAGPCTSLCGCLVGGGLDDVEKEQGKAPQPERQLCINGFTRCSTFWRVPYRAFLPSRKPVDRRAAPLEFSTG
jgi:hypothetical protein